jgi:hypothetical protein
MFSDKIVTYVIIQNSIYILERFFVAKCQANKTICQLHTRGDTSVCLQTSHGGKR